ELGGLLAISDRVNGKVKNVGTVQIETQVHLVGDVFPLGVLNVGTNALATGLNVDLVFGNKHGLGGLRGPRLVFGHKLGHNKVHHKWAFGALALVHTGDDVLVAWVSENGFESVLADESDKVLACEVKR